MVHTQPQTSQDVHAVAPTLAPGSSWTAERHITRSFPARLLLSRYVEPLALGAILVVAMWLRWTWIDYLPVEPESDFAIFYDMARTVAEGGWDPTSYGWMYQGAGYPTALAPLLALGGDLDAIRLANAVFQIGMVIAVWRLGRQLFGRAAGLIAAVIAATIPGLWTYVPLVAAENLAVLLIAVTALLLTRRERLWACFGSGAAASALAMIRPAYLPLLFVLILAILLAARLPAWRRALWCAAGAATVLVPFVALNLVNGGGAFSTAASTVQLWFFNNERATGAWFPANEDDDYPFHGLGSEAELLAAQRKLGTQFVFANPGEAASGLPLRFRSNWSRDDLGYYWTYSRASQDLREDVPYGKRLQDLINRYYLTVLVLAAIAALRFGRRPELRLPILLPLLYSVPLFAFGEGNPRYHAVMVPLLCVLAGAALVPNRGLLRRTASAASSVRGNVKPSTLGRLPGIVKDSVARGLRSGEAFLVLFLVASLFTWWLAVGRSLLDIIPWSDLAIWRWSRDDWPAWLIFVTVAVPLVRILALWLPGVLRRFTDLASVRPGRAWAGAATLLVALGVLVAGILTAAHESLAELAAVAPGGWDRYQTSPDGTSQTLPVILQDSGTPPDLREVSYPDAALLAFVGDPIAGETVGLVRQLDDLELGETYRFYIQVFDPAASGDPTETITIWLDDQVVWQRGPLTGCPAGNASGETTAEECVPGWRYVSVLGVAIAESVTIRVVRTAGEHPELANEAIPAVRTLHLYPKY